MVGSAGNAPVRRFQFYLKTLDLQSSNWIAAQKIGSGSGSYTHLKKFMRLLSVLWSSFPRWNGGGRRVTLPFDPACKAGASLFCHGPDEKSEWRMTNDKRNPNNQSRNSNCAFNLSHFVIGISFGFRHSSFVIFKWQAALVLPQAC